ncbi:hypothetical protein EA003_27040, partial [Vibrio anguillarum]|nr:hypothetical protein [Vibrio anguillarum]
TRNVQIDDVDIEAEQILVIESYSESYSSKQLSTLLVNENLKQQYDLALQEVDDKRNALFKALAKIFGKQAKAIPELICEAFGRPEKHLLELLTELCKQEHPDY